MNEYLNKYPKENINIGALIYSVGYEKAESICFEAIKKNKRIELITDNSIRLFGLQIGLIIIVIPFQIAPFTH